jgi:predicted amidophosphoribosyltransferase
MPCCNRRGCAGRFRDRVNAAQMLAILANHGTCKGCGNDVTDDPRFDPVSPVPYCPGCFEERWPTGAQGPFEYGKPQVYP